VLMFSFRWLIQQRVLCEKTRLYAKKFNVDPCAVEVKMLSLTVNERSLPTKKLQIIILHKSQESKTKKKSSGST